MLSKEKFSVLKAISEVLQVNESGTLSFDSLSRKLSLTKPELNTILNELEADRFINQFVLGKKDEFVLILTIKGFDAVQDEPLE
jgi:RIO-like serine/threonine protein kinase